VGKLTLENEFLKKALQNNVNHRGRRWSLSNGTSSKPSAEDVNS